MDILNNSEFIQILNSYNQHILSTVSELPVLLQRQDFKNLKLPNVNDNEIIDIYYLEAPLSLLNKHVDKTDIVDNNLFDINSYHTGVGFVYRKLNIQLVLDYSANDFKQVFLPLIENNEVKWNNQTRVSYYDYIDMNYWTKSSYVGEINHLQLKDTIKWSFDFDKNNYMYVFFCCYKLLSENIDNTLLNQKPFLRNSLCDTFCFDMFRFIEKNGGKIKFILPLRETLSTVLIKNSNDSQKLDYNNLVDKNIIINFYKDLATDLSKILMDKLPAIKEELREIIKEKDTSKIMIEIIKIMKDVNSIGSIIANMKKDYYIYYGYDENNKPSYYKLNNPNMIVNYIISNIERNIPIKDINQNVIFNPPTNILKKDNNYMLYVIILIILLFIIITWFLIRKKHIN
jgi:hypothetical protein